MSIFIYFEKRHGQARAHPMKSPDVPAAGRKPAGHAAMPRASRAPKLRMLSLRNWPVSRRLVAVIVMAVVMGLVFGGLRVAAAANTATGFARTNQLALLGQQVTALAQALENERDKTAGYDAAAGLDLGTAPIGATPIAYTKAQVGAYQTEMVTAQNETKTVAAGVKRLALQIDGAFPAVVQSKAQDVLNVIADLDGTRSAALAQSSQAAIESYS